VAGANRIESDILDACVYLTFEVGGRAGKMTLRDRERNVIARYMTKEKMSEREGATNQTRRSLSEILAGYTKL